MPVLLKVSEWCDVRVRSKVVTSLEGGELKRASSEKAMKVAPIAIDLQFEFSSSLISPSILSSTLPH